MSRKKRVCMYILSRKKRKKGKNQISNSNFPSLPPADDCLKTQNKFGWFMCYRLMAKLS